MIKSYSPKTKRNRDGSFTGYGNNADYLVGRIARDRPDILEQMKAGEYSSVRRAAIDAGIISVPHAEDRGLSILLKAWMNASLEDRQLFLWAAEEEIEAANEGRYLNPHAAFKGRTRPYSPADGAVYEPLEALIVAGIPLSEIARRMNVSYRTVARWRAGKSIPPPMQIGKLDQLAQDLGLCSSQEKSDAT